MTPSGVKNGRSVLPLSLTLLLFNVLGDARADESVPPCDAPQVTVTEKCEDPRNS